jgi:transposase InsO family protein
MIAIVKLLIWSLVDFFKSRGRLEAEVTVLRHQLNILRRRSPKRVRPNALDRAIFVWLYRLFPDIGNAVAIIRPETIVRWHRMGFRAYWRWKSRNLGGRPKIDEEIRDLVRRMCKENPLWGAPRIHGELLKLGFNVAQSTVSKYMIRRRGPPSQGWKTFLRNHADGIAAVDFLVVPTINFERLFAFVILGLGRRRILWIGVTTNPTAEWLANQITQAFPWDTAPTYLIRDNDGAYGVLFTRRLWAMGIRDRPITPKSPWQNGYVERVIGSIRRECLDHIVVFSAAHLRRVLTAYADYYNSVRTHLGIAKDAPVHRAIEASGGIISRSFLGGLHHQYARI